MDAEWNAKSRELEELLAEHQQLEATQAAERAKALAELAALDGEIKQCIEEGDNPPVEDMTTILRAVLSSQHSHIVQRIGNEAKATTTTTEMKEQKQQQQQEQQQVMRGYSDAAGNSKSHHATRSSQPDRSVSRDQGAAAAADRQGGTTVAAASGATQPSKKRR